MRTLAIWLALAVAGVGFAQEAVEAPSVNKRDRPITINHPEGATIQAIFAKVVRGNVVWEYLGDDHFDRKPDRTIFAAPPGEYLITSGDSTIIKIVEEGQPDPPRPEPGPEPQPEPEPDPQPSPDKLRINWAIWVEEISERPRFPDETATMRDADTRRVLSDLNIQMRQYDDDQPEAGPFLQLTDGTRPALILMQDAQKYLVFPAPKSPEDFETLVRRHAIR